MPEFKTDPVSATSTLPLPSARRVERPRKVAVIGAGITGATAAYALQRAGHAVTLIERHPDAAMETSFANGGQLSACNAEVWNHPSTVVKGMKWLFTPGAPLLVDPKPSWHKISWMAEFLRAIPHYEANTTTTTRLAIQSREHLFRIADEEGIDFDCVKRGIMHVYRTQKGFDHALKVSDLLARGGLARRTLTDADIHEIEPAVKGEFHGGFYTPSDFTGDIHKFTNGVVDAVRARSEAMGGAMRMGTEVTRIDHDAQGVTLGLRPAGSREAAELVRFDAVVISAGIASRRLAAMAGDRVNVYPVKGYSITVNLHTDADREAAPTVSLVDDDAKIVTSRLGPNRYRVAGTAEFNGENRDIRDCRIKPLIDWVRRMHPGVSTRDVRPWAGLRPMMPDMLPRVQAGRNPRVIYNTGHGHLGWTLSAATAELAAGLVADVEPAATAPRPTTQRAAA